MATIYVNGNAVVIKSALKLEDVKNLRKFRPSALQLVDKKENPVFAVGLTSGHGEVSDFGISFAKENHSDDERATATLVVDGNPKDYILNEIPQAILSLNEVEAQAVEASKDVAADKAVIEAAIHEDGTTVAEAEASTDGEATI